MKKSVFLLVLFMISLVCVAEGEMLEKNQQYETSSEQSEGDAHHFGDDLNHMDTSDDESTSTVKTLRFLPQDQHNCVKSVEKMLVPITSPVHRAWTAAKFCDKCPVPKLCEQHLIATGENIVRSELSLKKVPKSYMTYDPYSNKYWERDD